MKITASPYHVYWCVIKSYALLKSCHKGEKTTAFIGAGTAATHLFCGFDSLTHWNRPYSFQNTEQETADRKGHCYSVFSYWNQHICRKKLFWRLSRQNILPFQIMHLYDIFHSISIANYSSNNPYELILHLYLLIV